MDRHTRTWIKITCKYREGREMMTLTLTFTEIVRKFAVKLIPVIIALGKFPLGQRLSQNRHFIMIKRSLEEDNHKCAYTKEKITNSDQYRKQKLQNQRKTSKSS